MIRNRKLHTAVQIGIPALTFAVGWTLRPAASPEGTGEETNRSRETAAAARRTSLSRGPNASERGTGAAAASALGRAAVLLTPAEIEELGRTWRSETDPIARREAFAKLIAGLTAENALVMREQIAHLSPNDPEFRDFHFAWGKVGGMDAVLHGTKTDKADMGPTFAGWASANPAAATAWFDSLEGKTDKFTNQEHLKEALVHGLAIADPAAASQFVLRLGAAGDPRAKQWMSVVTDKAIQSGGLASASSWAAALPAGDLRGHALYEVARARVRDDPAAAAAWAAPLANDPNAGNVAYGISSEWGWRDGPAAVRWLDSLPGEHKAAAYGPALGGWTKVDPAAASQYIADMPPSAGRDHAIGGMIHTHRWEDPAAAIVWAGQLGTNEGRVAALTLAAEAYVRKDPVGAAEWLPSSGLPAATRERLLGPK